MQMYTVKRRRKPEIRMKGIKLTYEIATNTRDHRATTICRLTSSAMVTSKH